MLIHILTLMMMFMINLMTFNSLDGMEEAVLREASVLPAVLQNWPGAIWAIMTLQIYTTQTVSLSIFQPMHISLTFV